MTPARIHLHFLSDMLEAVQAALEFIDGVDLATFRSNREKLFAVVRALEVLGEAANHVPDAVKARHADLPWREMIATRNKVIHEYFGVDAEVVWRTVREDLPGLEDRLRAVVEKER